MSDLAPDQVFTVAYPFIRATYTEHDGEGPVDMPTWKPGTRVEDWGDGNAFAQADAMGLMALTVVSTHRPGKYPTRVFFTRRFTSPDGKAFGKGTLHVCSLAKFFRLTTGYQVPFEMADAPPRARRDRVAEAQASFEAAMAEQKQKRAESAR